MKEYEELVKALLYCKEHDQCDKDSSAECPYEHHWTDGEDCQNLLLAAAADVLTAAADALEAADKRIAELEAQMPKEGEWISGYDGFEWEVRCSVCGEEALIKEGGSNDHAYSNYCPNCGAKMDGKEQNDE